MKFALFETVVIWLTQTHIHFKSAYNSDYSRRPKISTNLCPEKTEYMYFDQKSRTFKLQSLLNFLEIKQNYAFFRESQFELLVDE